MQEFQYELMSNMSIKIKYNYGGEFFTFNMYPKEGYWIIHPFEGILLGNRQMCVLVLKELFQNKSFHVMLAKEQITFNSIRSSIDLSDSEEMIFTTWERDAKASEGNPVKEFIQSHTLDDIICLEKERLNERISFYRQILQLMFMQDLGPDDPEFIAVQRIIHAFETAVDHIQGSSGPHFPDRKRF
ncbi:hypothetical protein SAMN04488542_115111 [Fontibacillus panacisegetis]|uniref:Uncharacterized protein n=1 Tax=Fontibacillus panacisegetis TaxID=670482 RepID=A0A1G7ND66_9BACL|nr:hypothetical protein [Fontibacillus panacisegetis]SDF71902.1 hypothetical protein SAMN04488542_115111 [Fontibacillus panacisegetis]